MKLWVRTGDRLGSSPQTIHSDPEILSGRPVFVGTRVPFQALIDYLGGGQPLTEFLDDFPSVTRDQALLALQQAAQALVADACPA